MLQIIYTAHYLLAVLSTTPSPRPPTASQVNGLNVSETLIFLRKKLTSAATLEAISMKSSNEISPSLHPADRALMLQLSSKHRKSRFLDEQYGSLTDSCVMRAEKERTSQVMIATELI